MKISSLFITTALFFSSTIILANKLPDILHAARNGDAQSVRAHLEKGNNCAIKDAHGNNALHLAAEQGHAEIIQLLTAYYENCGILGRLWSYVSGPTLPNIDERNSESNTPLHCASEQGKIDAAVMLLKKGANKNLVNRQNLSAAFIALHKDNEELLKKLIENGFDPRSHTNNNHPMLAWAIIHNKKRSLNFLASDATLVNAPDTRGIKPIHMAAQTNDHERFALLISKKADITATDNAGNTVIHHSAMAGTDEVMNFLFDNYATMTGKNRQNTDAFIDKNKDGENPLSLASKYKQNKTFYLLAKRLNTNLKVQNDNNDTFLHMAALHNNGELAMNLLVEDKVPVVKNKQGNIFYHYFIEHGNLPVLQTIKASGIPLTECDADENTPLQIAIKNKQKQCVSELLDPRTINHKNKHGETALCLAAAHNYASEMETLIRNGAHKFLSDPIDHALRHDALDALKTLQQHGVSLTGRINDHGDSRAHFAAKYGSINILRYFESNNIPLDIRNNKGNDPFFIAAMHGNLEETKFLLKETHYKNRDVERAFKEIQNEQARNYKNVYAFLVKEHNSRVTEGEAIELIYKKGKNVATQKEELLKNNEFSFWDRLRYSVNPPTHYSSAELYVMSESQRMNVKTRNLEWHNKELTQKDEIEKKVAEIRRKKTDAVIIQQIHVAPPRQTEWDRIQAENRIKQAQEERDAKRANEERNRKQQEDARLQKEQADRNRVKQDRDKQQAADRERNRQQQQANDRARQERHDNALMAQHVPAASAPLLDENELVNSNLQPSAPPLEENRCHLCAAELKAKPLPCPKCRKKMTNTCPACVKKQNGKCAACNTPALGKKEEAIVKCCICFEPGSTIKIPCVNGNKHSAEICKSCVTQIKNCPICRAELPKN